MLPRPVPDHLRDPSKPPPKLSGKSLTNWVKNAKKELQNYDYQQSDPPFYIPSPCYQIFHIHQFTTFDTMNLIINHISSCRLFSIDTESDRHTYEIALIQVHSIPGRSRLPFFILFIELYHLSPLNSQLFRQIHLLFQVLFKSGNTITSWGPPFFELEKALKYQLFSFPLACKCRNLQLEFKPWIEGQPPPCEECLSDGFRRCRCGKNYLPHVDTQEPWSLQNAIHYSCNKVLDKTFTKSSRSRILDPKYSSLSSSTLQNLIRYASYDCLAVTYLRRPVFEKWSINQLQQSSISDLLTDPSLSTLDIDLEDVSDNEIPVFSRISSTDINQLSKEQIQPLITSTSSINKEVSNVSRPVVGSHSRRSIDARKKRNKKRNRTHRLHRYDHKIIRPVYYRFKMFMIKNILRDLHIQFVHVQYDDNKLIIGLKNAEYCEHVNKLLPGDLFDRHHYYRR